MHWGITINWRFFSLEEINLAAGKHLWERDWSYGRVVDADRRCCRTNMSLLDRWYAKIRHELHTLGGNHMILRATPTSDVGVNVAIFDAALMIRRPFDDVRATINGCRRAIRRRRSFDGQCLFWAGAGGPAVEPVA